jgi:DNA polymerase III alpha subunit
MQYCAMQSFGRRKLLSATGAISLGISTPLRCWASEGGELRRRAESSLKYWLKVPGSISPGLNAQSYVQRLDTELKVTAELGAERLFLIVAACVDHMRAGHILLAPGYGLEVGSLLCMLLGITNIDPLRYGLLFKRFASVERGRMPHFSVAVDPAGYDAAVWKTGRLLGPPTFQAEKGPRDPLTMTSFAFGPLVDGGLHIMCLNASKSLPRPLGALATIRFEEPWVLSQFQRGEVGGVFRLEFPDPWASHLPPIATLLQEARPRSFDELITTISVHRESTRESGATAAFVRGDAVGNRMPKNAGANVHKGTRGTIVFQEQLMSILTDVGGFSGGDADIARRELMRRRAPQLQLLSSRFKRLLHAANHCFLKCHAVAMGMLSWASMYRQTLLQC